MSRGDDPGAIVEGDYTYVRGVPVECIGHRYRVLDANVLYVPVNQRLVLVEALTGPHKGLRFVCSHGNFQSRYEKAK